MSHGDLFQDCDFVPYLFQKIKAKQSVFAVTFSPLFLRIAASLQEIITLVTRDV